MPTVLALETSCDESAAAVVRDSVVLSSEVASQVAEHAQFGGVVPEGSVLVVPAVARKTKQLSGAVTNAFTSLRLFRGFARQALMWVSLHSALALLLTGSPRSGKAKRMLGGSI